jgi:hypothetical protein
VCGCGVPDTDSDGDGTPDCVGQNGHLWNAMPWIHLLLLEE